MPQRVTLAEVALFFLAMLDEAVRLDLRYWMKRPCRTAMLLEGI